MPKSQINFDIPETGKVVYLTVDFPEDTAPNMVTLELPYVNGILITRQQVLDLLKDYEADGNKYIDQNELAEALKNYITKNELSVELQNYYTKEEVDNLLKEALEKSMTFQGFFPDKAALDNIQEPTKNGIYITADGNWHFYTEAGWKTIEVDIKYTNSKPTPIALGGVEKGTTFKDMTFQDFVTMLLYPYQPAEIVTLSTPKTQYEIGQGTGTKLRVTWSISNIENIKKDTVKLYFDGKLIGDKLDPAGAKDFTIPDTKLTSSGSKSITLEVEDNKKGKRTRTVNLVWMNAVYYGTHTAETITADVIKNFTKSTANSAKATYKYGVGGYKYIAIPNEFPTLTKFIDVATKFDVPMERLTNISITSNLGVTQEYKVWRSYNVLNGSITIQMS